MCYWIKITKLEPDGENPDIKNMTAQIRFCICAHFQLVQTRRGKKNHLLCFYFEGVVTSLWLQAAVSWGFGNLLFFQPLSSVFVISLSTMSSSTGLFLSLTHPRQDALTVEQWISQEDISAQLESCVSDTEASSSTSMPDCSSSGRTRRRWIIQQLFLLSDKTTRNKNYLLFINYLFFLSIMARSFPKIWTM